ncbi:MAG: hypothetical protein KIH80_007950 [Flavobacteriia bacterium]|nr:hypothetical protein [Flavobacteriia bacterium]
MKNQLKSLWFIGILGVFQWAAFAQGPPITADKPIMLGGGSFTAKTLIEHRKTDGGTFRYSPLMLHYVIHSNALVALHIPRISYDLASGASGQSLADVKLLGKYQFLRIDGTGKTFRMVAKTLQTLPTGAELGVMELSAGLYQGYYGLVAGYESLRYGISMELGLNHIPQGDLDFLQHKLGFGLPLLKPQYPNRQINLFFEYNSQWLWSQKGYQLLYAQGIQYARKNITFDLAYQLPLVNDMPEGMQFKRSLFLGSRFTF